MTHKGAGVRIWCVAAVLAVIVIAAFWPCVNNAFLNWDDEANFVQNSHFRGLGVANIKWAWITSLLGVYQPVAWMAFEAQYCVFGLDPRGYHLVSILLHAANTVLLFLLAVLLLRRYSRDYYSQSPLICLTGAALATGLYAVHPLRVEPVAWASCQPYLVCVFFYLLAIGAYLLAFPSESQTKWRWLAASFLFTVLALFSKALAVSVPFVLLILDVYPLRRIGWKERGGWFGRNTIRVWLEKLPYFAAAAIFMLIATSVRRTNIGTTDIFRAAYVVCFYLVKSVAPSHLTIIYVLPHADFALYAKFAASILAIAGISAGAYLLRRRVPGLLAAWLVYLVTVAPTTMFVPVTTQVAADRYCHLPTMAFAILAAATPFLQLYRKHGGAAGVAALTGAGVGCMGLLLVLTAAQCRTWRTSHDLWSHAYRQGSPGMSRVHNFFGLVLSGRGMLGDAAREFHVAIDLDPNFGEPHNNLGAALGMDGRLDEAAREFAEAIRADPYCYGAYNNLGTVYAKRGDVRRALGLYAKSLSIEPDYDGAADNLNELIKSNQLPAPLVGPAKAISDNPRDKAAHQALAAAIQ